MILAGFEVDDSMCSAYEIRSLDVKINLRGLTEADARDIQGLAGKMVKLVKHVTKEDRVDDYKERGMLR